MMRRAWLQKHPTPAARGGEFHWYPADGDRELRASLVERLAGAPPGAVLWQLAPGQLAWAQTFTAAAPPDDRRYTGLALAIVEGEGPPAALLAELPPVAATPWREGDDAATAAPGLAAIPVLPDPVAVARALLDGGAAAVGELAAAGLPRAIAAIERGMPPAVIARVRRGMWVGGTAARAPDRIAELAVAAEASPGSRAARAWQLACELAANGRALDDLGVALERELGRAPADWLATLNAWGRGRAAHDLDALADRLALRVLAQLAADRDPAWAIAEARWHALLPPARRGELLEAVARRADILKELVHA